MAHALEGVQFLYFRLLNLSVAMCDADVHSLLQCPSVDSSYGDAACVAGIVERGDEHLRCAFYDAWGRDDFNDFVEEVGDVVGRLVVVVAHPSVFGGAIDNGEV